MERIGSRKPKKEVVPKHIGKELEPYRSPDILKEITDKAIEEKKRQEKLEEKRKLKELENKKFEEEKAFEKRKKKVCEYIDKKMLEAAQKGERYCDYGYGEDEKLKQFLLEHYKTFKPVIKHREVQYIENYEMGTYSNHWESYIVFSW